VQAQLMMYCSSFAAKIKRRGDRGTPALLLFYSEFFLGTPLSKIEDEAN
jgi:hypothetical protein